MSNPLRIIVVLTTNPTSNLAMQGSTVVNIPQMGHDLVVFANDSAYNIGKVTEIRQVEGLRASWNVKTTRYPDHLILVNLSERVNIPFS